MNEMSNHCLLGKTGTSPHCRHACSSCGWSPEVEEARNAEIAANGLTTGPDGLRRLIIRKEVENNEGTE